MCTAKREKGHHCCPARHNSRHNGTVLQTAEELEEGEEEDSEEDSEAEEGPRGIASLMHGAESPMPARPGHGRAGHVARAANKRCSPLAPDSSLEQ